MATHTGAENSHPSGTRKDRNQPSTSVSYIPPQSDNLAVTANEAAWNGPFVLAIRDVVTFVRMLNLFPTIFIPFWTNNPQDEFYLGDSNLFGLIALTLASVIPIVLLLLAIPAFVFLPGSLCVLVVAAGTVLIRLICKPFEGPTLVTSARPTDEAVIARQHLLNSERWIFMNGCCVTGHALQQNLNLLSETFGRPVQGVHNETWGILGDIVECIIQRAFGFYSKETRIAFEFVKAYCSDPKVTKVVLFGHSQGGIMVSQILDELFMDLPSESIAKLEVYTFGNAASHFNNPLRKPANSTGEYPYILIPNDPTPQTAAAAAAAATTSDSPTTMVSPMARLPSPPPTPWRPLQKAMLQTSSHSRNFTISPYLPERVIPHIEHYCNSEDMVTRWGTLYSVKNVLGNRFCGHVFIYEGASGHMLNQHYLAKMFPIRDHPAAHDSFLGPDDDDDNIPFLDRIVEVDSATVAKRDVNAAKQLTILRHDSIPLDAAYSPTASVSAAPALPRARVVSSNPGFEGVVLGEGDALRPQDLAGAEGSRITVARTGSSEAVRGSRGKRVRDLSRLWRYMGGESPLD